MLLGLLERQVKRLRKAYREGGAGGLAHGNRGRPSSRRTPPEEAAQIVALAKAHYRDYNDTDKGTFLLNSQGDIFTDH